MSEHKEATMSKRRVLGRRTLSTVVLWVLIGTALAVRQVWLFNVVTTLLVAVGLAEFFAMVVKNEQFKGFRRAAVVATWLAGMIFYVGGLVLAYPDLIGGSFAFFRLFFFWPVCLLLLFFLLFSLAIYMKNNKERIFADISACLFGYIYVPVLFSYLLWLLIVGSTGSGQAYNFRLVKGWNYLLFLIAVAKFSDMGAYLVGSWIGKHKMVPSISPNKTWQGFGGSILFTQLAAHVVVAFCGDAIAPIGHGHATVLAGLFALFATWGDLAESIIKRNFGVKDSGGFMPGIGGVLDLIDSVLFCAPVMFFYLLVLAMFW